MRKTSLLLLFTAVCLSSKAQTWQDTLSKIEQLFSRYKPGNPGCQFVISRDGQTIFSKAYGMADLEHGAPLTAQSPIEIGSVSKQFTAACILLLEQQGKLSLDDNVRKYISELPHYGVLITLRSMIHHLSGLKDWESIVGLAGEPVGKRVYDNDDVLDLLSRQQTLNNKPGDEFLYSNSNYNLLAIVVKRASGMDLPEFSQKYIFGPAGMTHTRWRDNFREVVPGRAIAYDYDYDSKKYFADMPFENAYGNGGILTTAEDLCAWNNYYGSGKLGTPSLLPKQLEPGRLKNGDSTPYAAGLDRDSYKGWEKIGMGGNTGGYACGLVYFPELRLSFAFITNTSQNLGNIVDEVMNIFVRDKRGSTQMDKPTNQQAVTVTPSFLATNAGWYRNSRTGDALKLYMDGEKLAASNAGFRAAPEGPIIALGHHSFLLRYRGTLLVQPHKGLLFIYGGRDTVRYTAVDSAILTTKALQEYMGDYYSNEAAVKFSVRIKGKDLVLGRSPGHADALTPTYKDGFYYWRGTLYFERDGSNKITGMKISLPRARNIAFTRLRNCL